jgi:transcriptional regulator
MYVPEAFRDDRPEALHDLIRANSFGVLVTHADDGLIASHLPFVLDAARGQHGVLIAHVARANQHWRSLADRESLAIFEGPHAYVSPRWYGTPLAVPTWNYAVVHAYGRARLLDDPAEVLVALDRLVRQHDPDWAVPDGDFVPKLAAGVVAFEIEIARLEGKFKLSQNRPEGDRRSVVAALSAGGPGEAGVAAMMVDRGVAPAPDAGATQMMVERGVAPAPDVGSTHR